MKKTLLILALFLLPALTLAATPISWTLKNPSDTFIYPNPINGTSKFVLVGTSTIPSDVVTGDIFRVQGQTNDFIDGAVENVSSGVCATAEWDAQNNLTTLTNHFAAFGITGGSFTGSGCSNVPYTGFLPDSSYILNPNGDINFALGTTSSNGQFKWFTQGYATQNLRMILTAGGSLGLGSTTPDSPLTITNNLTSFATPVAGTSIHFVQSGANARIVGDTYNGGAVGTNYQGRKAQGTNLAPLSPNANDSLVLIGGDGYGKTKFHDASVGSFVIKAEGAPYTDTSAATYASIFTTPTTSVSALERMRITGVGDVGFGSTSPFANFVIQANPFDSDIDTVLFIVASSTATATTTAFRIDNTGHIFASSTNPVLSTCGTSPTMLGSDHHGTVTAGATANGCTITFGIPYPVAPTCVISNQSMSVINAMTYAVSASAITVAETGLGGAKFDFICYGN